MLRLHGCDVQKNVSTFVPFDVHSFCSLNAGNHIRPDQKHIGMNSSDNEISFCPNFHYSPPLFPQVLQVLPCACTSTVCRFDSNIFRRRMSNHSAYDVERYFKDVSVYCVQRAYRALLSLGLLKSHPVILLHRRHAKKRMVCTVELHNYIARLESHVKL